MHTLVPFFTEVEKVERNMLNKKTFLSTLFARFISLIFLGLLSIIFSLVIILIGDCISDNLFDFNNPKNNYILSIGLLMFFPLSIPIFTNLFNNEFCYTSVLNNINDSITHIRENFSASRLLLEIFLFIFYIIINIYVTVYALGNFVDENIIVDWLEFNSSPFLAILFTIHTAIYLSFRIYSIPNDTIKNKYKKKFIEFNIWSIVLLITICYMFFVLINNFNTLVMIYLIGVLLISIIRFITNYKELREIINELQDYHITKASPRRCKLLGCPKRNYIEE